MGAPVASAFKWTTVHGLQMTFATVTLTGLLICFSHPTALHPSLVLQPHATCISQPSLGKGFTSVFFTDGLPCGDPTGARTPISTFGAEYKI